MDVGKHTTTGDGGLDKQVKLFVTTDGELKVTGRDTLDAKVFGGVTWGQRAKWKGMSQQRYDPPASSRTSAVRYSRIAAT